MRSLVQLSRLDPQWHLQRGDVLAFVLQQPHQLQLARGTVWLTRNGEDEIVQAPASLHLAVGPHVVVEAMADNTGLRLDPV